VVKREKHRGLTAAQAAQVRRYRREYVERVTIARIRAACERFLHSRGLSSERDLRTDSDSDSQDSSQALP
jgi:hypothetical protein